MVNTWDAGPSASLSGLVFSVSCSLSLSLWASALQPHTHTISQSHTLVTCTCCYDEIKGTQDQDFSCSFSDSLPLPLSCSCSCSVFGGQLLFSLFCLAPSQCAHLTGCMHRSRNRETASKGNGILGTLRRRLQHLVISGTRERCRRRSQHTDLSSNAPRPQISALTLPAHRSQLSGAPSPQISFQVISS